jgi:adenosylcobinamide-phosphate synthase
MPHKADSLQMGTAAGDSQKDFGATPEQNAGQAALAVTWHAITFVALSAALLFDRVVGDPSSLWSRVPHPVVLVGRLIDRLDAGLNDAALLPATRRQRGVAATAALVALAGAAGLGLSVALSFVPFGRGVEAILLAVLLAQKSLIDHVEAVGRALLSGGVAGGRQAVAQIVGRDVSSLDEAGVSRAAMESAAENFSDGVVAPAFWYALLGLPGVFIYKAANTADSMIGHRSPKYEAFGWAAARLDDALSFVPARLSAVLIAAAATLSGCDGSGAARAARLDAARHKSPNAGWPEAALAGALGVAFGGPRRYGEMKVDGAWLNPAGRREAGPGDILAAIRLIDAAWAILLVLSSLAAIILLATAQ